MPMRRNLTRAKLNSCLTNAMRTHVGLVRNLGLLMSSKDVKTHRVRTMREKAQLRPQSGPWPLRAACWKSQAQRTLTASPASRRRNLHTRSQVYFTEDRSGPTFALGWSRTRGSWSSPAKVLRSAIDARRDRVICSHGTPSSFGEAHPPCSSPSPSRYKTHSPSLRRPWRGSL